MLSIDVAEHKLTQMLTDAGMQVDKLELIPAWAVFKSFAELPFDTTSDGLLFEYGIFGSRDLFLVSFTRQFQYLGDDEYMQLSIEFYYPVNDQLRQINAANDWCFSDEACLDDFAARVETSEAVKAVQSLAPARTAISFSGT